MVATVGSISIDLSTNVAKFTQGFNAAAATVDKQSKRMSNAVNGFSKASKAASGIVSGFVGGIAAGGALAALGSLSGALNTARQSLSDFEEIGNRAKATGLGTDTFQAISHGASLADVEQESLNKALEIFAKNVGLAEQGTGAMYAGLKKLNPELLRSVLNATNQEDRLKLVADAMAGMTDATEKAALATAVFGRGGAEMVRVLDKGSQSIDEMKRNAENLGIIIPEELIKRSGELDDQLTTLATVINVNLKSALANLGPLLVTGATGLAEFAKGVNQLATALKEIPGPGVDILMKLVELKSLVDPSRIGAAIGEALVDSVAAAQDDAEALDRLQTELRETQKELHTLFEQGRDGFTLSLNAAIDATIARVEELKQEIAATGQAAVEAGDQVRRAFLAEAFRASENASMDALAKLRPPTLPTVWHGTERVHDYETGSSGEVVSWEKGSSPESLERHFDQVEADAEEQARRDEEQARREEEQARRDEQRRRAIEDTTSSVDNAADRTIAYWEDCTKIITGRYNDATREQTSALLAGWGPLAGGGRDWPGWWWSHGGGGPGMDLGGPGGGPGMDLGPDIFGQQRNTRGGGSQYTMSTKTGGFGDVIPSSSIAESATSAGDANINVSVMVKPVLEGQRLSSQSTAEIKQAAAVGANAALRSFYGR